MSKSSKKVDKKRNNKADIKEINSEHFYSTLIGKNPTGFFVTIILCLLIICFTILVCTTKLIENNAPMIIGFFTTAMAALIAYFAGNNKSK